MTPNPERTPKKTTVVAVVDIADGNPAAAWAEYCRRAHRAVELRTGEVVKFVSIKHTAKLGALFHKLMSAGLFGAYREKSEATRTGPLGKALQVALWLELAAQLDALEAGGAVIDTLVLIQEFPLLGAQLVHSKWLDKLQTITLVVPDVFPKDSAKLAAKQAECGTVRFSVWNDEALRELFAEYAAEKSKHGIVHGFEQNLLFSLGVPVGYPELPEYVRLLQTGTKPFAERGVPVVVKSSGSGMPGHVLDAVQARLEAQGVQHYEIHLPDRVEIYYKGVKRVELAPLDKIERLRRFYLALGKKTERLLCYPSELVGVVYEMRQFGSPVQLEVIDEPRGEHEQKNRGWAAQQNLLSMI